jgi:hypothetical protein
MQRYRPFSLKEGHGMSDVTNEPIRFGDYILYSDFVSYTDFGKEIIVEKDATIAALNERLKGWHLSKNPKRKEKADEKK